MGCAGCEEDAASINAEQSNIISRLLSFRSWRALGILHHMTYQKVAKLDAELRQFYEESIKVTLEESIAIGTGKQGSAEWIAARKRCLNSSKARAQYTYYINPNADWDHHYQELYHPKFKGNKFTQDGLESEEPARDLYEDTHGCRVCESSLLIRPELPWMGTSLDGTVIDDVGNFLRNIEIKTFKEGLRLKVCLGKLLFSLLNRCILVIFHIVAFLLPQSTPFQSCIPCLP